MNAQKPILVTGGAGFIGSNLVRSLNDNGREDIVIVDTVTAPKTPNIKNLRYKEIVDKKRFRCMLRDGFFDANSFQVMIHEGACSNTTETDETYLRDNNCGYSNDLLQFS